MQLINTVMACLQVKADFGLAKAIDGLHRVTDQKQTATVALLPTGGQFLQQQELPPGSILKLVHQNMPNATVQMQQQFSRCIDLAKRPPRRQGNLDKIALTDPP